MLQESRDYCIELCSPLHACYLDAKAAFDKVWLTGLVYKLHTMGIRGKLLRIVNSTLRGTRSQVLHDGRLSKPFNIEQGTRQGSICAPFYNTVYINDLLKDLSASTYGLHIGEVPLSAPTQADDIVLFSLSRKGLQEMLDMCRNYANRWRYTYNPAKCSSMLMDRRHRQNTPLPVLRYRETLIQENPTYTPRRYLPVSYGTLSLHLT